MTPLSEEGTGKDTIKTNNQTKKTRNFPPCDIFRCSSFENIGVIPTYNVVSKSLTLGKHGSSEVNGRVVTLSQTHPGKQFLALDQLDVATWKLNQYMEDL